LPHDKVLLFGLEEPLAAELASALAAEGLAFRQSSRLEAAVEPGICLVFCSAEKETCALLLDFVRQENLALPVVVVSPLPTTAEWLDAIELGAADYCSPPFEPLQISWLLDNALRLRHPIAA
jgi:DNA-binding NtrC family response regulator